MKHQQRFIRIFISSTFSDMMPEREYLMKVVFPELRRRCKAKFIEVTEIDLRWGISEEDSKEGKVIEICLTEIDKSRPYFIGILGNRYGWVPSAGEYEKHQKIIEEFPWAKDDIDTGLSITEMEIQYGVLRNKNMDGRAFFYLKEGVEDLKEETLSLKKLTTLKEKLMSQRDFPVRNYDGIETLGKFILEDLWQQIEQDFPDEEIPDDHERETLNHWGVLNNHTHFFLDFDQKINEIKSAISGSGKVLIYGEKGLGKSALLSNLVKSTPEKEEVVFYFCGASPQSNGLENMVRHISESLKREFDIEYQIPKKVEHPGNLLSAFINAVPGERDVLIVIDGTDQLITDFHNNRLQWIPSDLPQHVKLLVSTSSEVQLELLQKQHFEVVRLNTIGAEAIKDIAVNYFSFYSKKLPAGLLEKISHFPLAGTPVVLFTLLNELRIFGMHEELESHVNYYTSTQNTDQFFSNFLQQLEHDFENEKYNLKGVLTSIHLSKKGLTENEIIDINGISKLKWSQLYNVLGFHLINNSGLLKFSNQYIEQAIQTNYLSNEQDMNERLNPLLNYFNERFAGLSITSANEELPRIVEELPDLAARAGDLETLKATLTFLPALMELFEKRNEEVAGFLGLLKGRYKLSEIYAEVINHFVSKAENDSDKIKACFIVGDLLGLHDAPAQAVPFFNKVLELFNQSRIKSSFVFEALKELSIIYSQLGYYEASAYVLENLLPYQYDEDIADVLDLLAQEYKNAGKFEIAEILLQDTITYFADRQGPKSVRLAIQYNNLGRMYDVQKNFEPAEKNYLLASGITLDALGPEHSLYQRIQSNIGILYMHNRRLDDAEAVLTKVLGIRKSLYGDQHRLTLKTMNSLGVCKSLKGDVSSALKILNATAQSQKELLGEAHNDTLITYSNLADCYQKAGDLEAAEILLKMVLETTIQQYGEVHEQTINTCMGLADVLTDSKKTGEAIELYKFLVKIQQTFYGENHPIVGLTRYKLAGLNLQNNSWDEENINDYIKWNLYKASQSANENDPETAAERYLEVVQVINKFLDGNHPAIFEAMDNLAGIYHRLREFGKAADFCKQIADMAVTVYGEGQPATLEYRTLQAFNLHKNGDHPEAFDILSELGNYHEALLNFKKQFVIKMYREMLEFYNSMAETIKKFESETAKFAEISEMAEQHVKQAIDFYQNDKNTDALTHLDKAIEQANVMNDVYGMPFGRAFQYKAAILDELEDYKQAVETITEGIHHIAKWNCEFDVRTFFLYKLAGDIFLKLDNFEVAAKYFSQAAKANVRAEDYPNEETVSLNTSLIMISLQAKQLDKALHLIDESLPLSGKINGDDHEVTVWLKGLRKEILN